MVNVATLEPETRNATVEVELLVSYDEAAKQFVLYLPALEAAYQGDTEQEARDAATELVPDMINNMAGNATLVSFLLRRGWTVTTYPTPNLVPPRLRIDHIDLPLLHLEPMTVSLAV